MPLVLVLINYRDIEQPEWIFDSLLDEIPDDLELVDDHYEDMKRTKASWLEYYQSCYWRLDNLEDVLTNSEPLQTIA